MIRAINLRRLMWFVAIPTRRNGSCRSYDTPVVWDVVEFGLVFYEEGGLVVVFEGVGVPSGFVA